MNKQNSAVNMEITSAFSSIDKTTRLRFPVDAEAAMLLLRCLAAACCWTHTQNHAFGGLVRVRIVCSACAHCHYHGLANNLMMSILQGSE